jgi:nucleotide-binding universal stress UspA family protein
MEPHPRTSSATDGTLVVGIDFSDCCERALLNAVTLAEHGEGQVQLELVHVFEWPGESAPPAGEYAQRSAGRGEAARTAVVAQSQASLQRLARLCSTVVGDRVAAKIHVLIGDPAVRLLAAAELLNASLIVLGTLGRRMQPRGELGSTAERVKTGSHVPVLLVP